MTVEEILQLVGPLVAIAAVVWSLRARPISKRAITAIEQVGPRTVFIGTQSPVIRKVVESVSTGLGCAVQPISSDVEYIRFPNIAILDVRSVAELRRVADQLSRADNWVLLVPLRGYLAARRLRSEHVAILTRYFSKQSLAEAIVAGCSRPEAK